MVDFLGLGNYGANLLTGGGSMPRASSYVVHDFRDDYALLKEWGTIYRKTFRWQSGWGDWHEVHTAKHPTPEAADNEARAMALSSGYAPPRWWAFWRTGEKPLPASIKPL